MPRSGRPQRCPRGGNRQLNAALHRIAVTQARCHADARAYLERKKAEGLDEVGVDVHKQSLTAAAVDETGRLLAERTLAGGEDGLLTWAAALDGDRSWAVGDCRHVTGALERQLVAAGERLVRLPPKLTAPERRAGRKRGKSDAIDALGDDEVAKLLARGEGWQRPPVSSADFARHGVPLVSRC